MKRIRFVVCPGSRVSQLLLACVLGLTCGLGAASPQSDQSSTHTGTRLEGLVTIVEPDTLTVFDRVSQQIQIHTDKDYTSHAAIAAPVIVWYTTEGGVNHLQSIEFPATLPPLDSAQVTNPDLIRRIVILPQVADVDDSEGLISAITRYLEDNTGWYVAPSDLALEIAKRNEAFGSESDEYDADTGGIDLDQQRPLMMAIAKKTHSDAVLAVRIIKVKADVRGSVASWDDMKEPVGSGKSKVLSGLDYKGGKGWVYAATTDMYLWSRTGKLLWKKRRGFAVLALQSGFSGSYRHRPLTAVYDNSAVMQNWLSSTLGDLAPSGMAAAPETQVSPELQKQLDKAKQAGEQPE